MDIKPDYPTTKERKPTIDNELERYLPDSFAAKLYNRMIFNRIRTTIDTILRKNPSGFRTGCSGIQQIQILRRILDGAYSQNIPIFITFVDFKKAFDSIVRTMMFAILRHYHTLISTTAYKNLYLVYACRMALATLSSIIV